MASMFQRVEIYNGIRTAKAYHKDFGLDPAMKADDLPIGQLYIDEPQGLSHDSLALIQQFKAQDQQFDSSLFITSRTLENCNFKALKSLSSMLESIKVIDTGIQWMKTVIDEEIPQKQLAADKRTVGILISMNQHHSDEERDVREESKTAKTPYRNQP